MSINLLVGGKSYSDFLSATVDIRLDAICRTFTFQMARTASEVLPFTVGESVEVFVNENLVLTGTIEVLGVSYGEGFHSISITGRDLSSDILDSQIDSFEFNDMEEGISLKNIIEAVLRNIRSDVKVINTVKGLKPFDVFDLSSPEAGDNAFSFAEKYAKQRQVLLNSDEKGNILISTSTGKSSKGVLKNVIGGEDNNIISANYSHDNSGRFNLYKITSEGNPSVAGGDTAIDLDGIVSRSGRSIDNNIRKGRTLILESESSFSDGEAFNRSKWEANIRRVRGRVYTANVFGFALDGSKTGEDIWKINRLILISDDFCGLHKEMLVNNVIYSLDESGGSKTKISVLEKEAYSLALEEPVDDDSGI